MDDEELIRHSGRALLAALGHTVDLAPGGADALALVKATSMTQFFWI